MRRSNYKNLMSGYMDNRPVKKESFTYNIRDCPQGFYCPLNATGGWFDAPIKCPTGSFCPTGSTGFSYPPGFTGVRASTGVKGPVACPTGHYCITGSSSSPFQSSKCPTGFYCEGYSKPKACPQGSFCPEGSSGPTLCAPGYYQPKSEKGSCLPCPVGKYCGDKNVNGGRGTVNPMNIFDESDPLKKIYAIQAQITPVTYMTNNAYSKQEGATKQDLKSCGLGQGWPSRKIKEQKLTDKEIIDFYSKGLSIANPTCCAKDKDCQNF